MKTYTLRDADYELEVLLKRTKRLTYNDICRAHDALCTICNRKRQKPSTAKDAALIALERIKGYNRRLSHQTGATGWL